MTAKRIISNGLDFGWLSWPPDVIALSSIQCGSCRLNARFAFLRPPATRYGPLVIVHEDMGPLQIPQTCSLDSSSVRFISAHAESDSTIRPSRCFVVRVRRFALIGPEREMAVLACNLVLRWMGVAAWACRASYFDVPSASRTPRPFAVSLPWRCGPMTKKPAYEIPSHLTSCTKSSCSSS